MTHTTTGESFGLLRFVGLIRPAGGSTGRHSWTLLINVLENRCPRVVKSIIAPNGEMVDHWTILS